MNRVHDWSAAEAVLEEAELLLLDFDGPVCSVFAGLPASEVADRLRGHLRREHPGPLPGLDQTGADPFDVLAYAAAHAPEHVVAVEAEFTRLECVAVQTAEPTPGAHAFIVEWSRTGRPLAIVSNNSVEAIRKYLDAWGIAEGVSYISARTPQLVDKLKPCPDLLSSAVELHQAMPGNTVFIGDSHSDLVAGQSAEVVFIGFANKPEKVKLFYGSAATIVNYERADSGN